MRALHTRRAALDILVRVDETGAFTSDLLGRAARSEAVHLPLLQRLVKGTLEWRDRIDHEIARHLGAPAHSLSPVARNVVRLAAYQLLFLEKVPVERVVSESLALLTKEPRKIQERMQAVIEALREGGRLTAQAPARLDSATAIATHYSHPAWLVERWVKELGLRETAAFCAANNRAWSVSIRANTVRISPHQLGKRLAREGVVTTPSRFAPDCLVIKRLPKGRRLDRLEAFSQGLFQVQDESAALIGHLVRPPPHATVVDLCAAPGGKATHLAALMRNRGTVLAFDVNERRLQSISENCRRLGLTSVRIRRGDARTLTLPHPAERVLLDAPCSGFGVLGRKTDIRWSKNADTIAELTALQTKLIDHAATLVAPGGMLIYSTCTVERAENEAIVTEFLARHPEFTLEPPPADLPRELFSAEGFLRTYPHRHRIGGAFAAVLRRSGEGGAIKRPHPTRRHAPSRGKTVAGKKAAEKKRG